MNINLAYYLFNFNKELFKDLFHGSYSALSFVNIIIVQYFMCERCENVFITLNLSFYLERHQELMFFRPLQL